MNTQATIYTKMSQVPQSAELREMAEALIANAEKMTSCENEEDAATLSEYVAQCKKSAKKLDTQRLIATEAARNVVSDLNNEYNGFKEGLTTAASRADAILNPYLQMKARERKAEEDRIAAEEQERQDIEEQARIDTEEAERKQRELEAQGAAAEETAAAQKVVDESRTALDDLSNKPAVRRIIPEKSVTGVLGSKTSLRDNWKAVRDEAMSDDDFLVAIMGTPYMKELGDCVDWSAVHALAKAKKDKFKLTGFKAVNTPVTVSR